MNFDALLNAIKSKIPFLGGGQPKEPARLGPTPEEVDQSFRDKGLIKTTDTDTGKETWITQQKLDRMKQRMGETPRTFDQVKGMATQSANPYSDLTNSSAKQYNIPPEIFDRLLARESMQFNPDVISGKMNSPVGAQGIAQFMPETAKWWAKSHGEFDPLNPEQAIPASAHYLRYLNDQFPQWDQTLAAYNAGEGAVRQHGGIPPYDETQEYVKAILSGLGY